MIIANSSSVKVLCGGGVLDVDIVMTYNVDTAGIYAIASDYRELAMTGDSRL